MSSPGVARVAALWTTAAAATGAAAAGAVVAWQAQLGQELARLGEVPVIAASCLLGALVLTSRPGQPVGRALLAGGAAWGLGSLPVELLVGVLAENPGARAAGAALTVAFVVRGLGWLVLALVLPLVFPDGPSRRGRVWLRIAVADLVLFVVSVLALPQLVDDRLDAPDNPLGLPAELAVVPEAGAALVAVVGIACLLAGLLTVAARWRGGGRLVRQQVGWFALGLLAVLVGALVLTATAGEVDAQLFVLSVAPMPVAIGLAVLQHRLYEVDVLVNRALLYGSLTAAVAGLYVLVVAGVGAALGASGAGWLPWVDTAVVAVAVTPLREALQAAVNRVTFGAWQEPQQLLGSLHERLERAAGPDAALREVLGEVRDSLRLAALVVTAPDGATVAAAGTPGPAGDPYPLVHAGHPVGVLTVHGGRRRRRDQETLAVLAGALAPAVRAARLHADLQRSRERLVEAREEERRRLRRDLHDGVGSALAGLTFKIDALRNRLGDPEVLRELRADVQGVVADVRRLVEGLRPVALDELGLPEALRRLVERRDAGGPELTLATEDAGSPAAAVEVAAYRIVQEALTNVRKHAGASSCAVDVRGADGSLVVTVADDGTGLPRRGSGAGLDTMRERAEELGGSLAVLPRDGGGTVVRAVLPREPA